MSSIVAAADPSICKGCICRLCQANLDGAISCDICKCETCEEDQIFMKRSNCEKHIPTNYRSAFVWQG